MVEMECHPMHNCSTFLRIALESMSSCSSITGNLRLDKALPKFICSANNSFKIQAENKDLQQKLKAEQEKTTELTFEVEQMREKISQILSNVVNLML